MKRVLIFSLSYSPYWGGAEIAIKNIVANLPKNIAFTMITMRRRVEDKSYENIENIEVYRVGLGRGYLQKILYIKHAYQKALELHAKAPFDGAWAMMSYMVLPLVFMRLIAQIQIPYALTLQEGDSYDHVFRRLHILPFLPFLRIGFRNASVVQCISNYLASWAKGMGAKNIIVIPNGFDHWWFSQELSSSQTMWSPESFWKAKGKTSLANAKTVLITTSRLVKKNAVDDVIRALTKLEDGIHFAVLGDGVLRDYLQKLARTLNVEQRVHFLGEDTNTRVPMYLKASKIFVRPSRTEGMGNSFIEAMAAGIPVIATQEGGISDFLYDQKRNPDKPTTGWAVDKDNPEQIAEAVKDIIANPEQVKKVIETAKMMVFERYDWDLIARDMRTKVFDRLLSKGTVA